MDTPFSQPERLPPAYELEEKLAELANLEVSVKTISRSNYTMADTCALGVYRKSKTHVGALALADRYFSNFVGGALGQLSADHVRDQVKSPTLSDVILEHLSEFYRGLEGMLNTRGEPKLTFHTARAQSLPLDGQLGKLFEQAPNRIDVEASVHGYGKGRFALVLF